jgi:hypothetical protein
MVRIIFSSTTYHSFEIVNLSSRGSTGMGVGRLAYEVEECLLEKKDPCQEFLCIRDTIGDEESLKLKISNHFKIQFKITNEILQEYISLKEGGNSMEVELYIIFF